MIVFLLVIWTTACVPRQIKPVALIDPAPLLETVIARQIVFEKGLSGSLDLSFKNGKQRFNSKVYIVAYPDGRFRLEIPGFLGDTYLVMVSDNTEILAFYPGQNKAFRSAVNGRSINPHLPFPLPVDPTRLPALLMGVFSGSDQPAGVEGHLMDSGEKLLRTVSEDTRLQYSYLFDKGHAVRLRKITIKGKDIEVTVRTARKPSHLPLNFDITLPDGVLKGEWNSVAPFEGDRTVLELPLPASVTVTDLEISP